MVGGGIGRGLAAEVEPDAALRGRGKGAESLGEEKGMVSREEGGACNRNQRRNSQ